MKMLPNSRKRFTKKTRGTAVVELAVCLPLMLLFVLGTIESCTMIFLKQSLTISAYEGVRAALQSKNGAAVNTRCNAVLAERRVNNGQITITPNNFAALDPGKFITVTVSAPCNSNSVIPGSFFRGDTLEASATMMKEK